MSQHQHVHEHQPNKNLGIAFLLNLAFTLLEIVGGLWTNSVAILSDALHDLGDSVSLGMAYLLDRYAAREHDERYSYGYRRFSLLGALLNTLILVGGSIFILSEAIPRLLDPQMPNAGGMILFAIGGILVNGAAALRLRGGANLNARVVTWHLLEDVLGWVAVLIASIVMRFVDVPILDPLLSIGITTYVLYNILGYLRKTAAVFMQGVPEEVDLHQLQHRLGEIEPVQSVHHTHVWSLDGEHHVLTTHLVVPAGATAEEMMAVKRRVREMTAELPLAHTTVEIEREDEACSMG